jgi:hypothetical protein
MPSVPVIVGGRLYRVDAGDVHPDVQAAEGFDGCGRRGGDAVRVGGVGACVRGVSAAAGDVQRGLLSAGVVDVGDEDVGSGLGQPQGHGAADAGAGAGHDGGPAGE